MSIQKKLTLTIMGITSFILVISLSVFISIELNNLKESMLNNLRTISLLTGQNISGALLFHDKKTASENLQSLQATPHIEIVHIYNTNDANFTLFSSYQKSTQHVADSLNIPEKVKLLLNSQKNGALYIDKKTHLVQTIILDQDLSTIGMIYIVANRNAYWQQINRYIRTTLMMLLIAFLMTIIFASKAQKTFILPILELLNSMKNISKKHNYSERINNSYRDEFGQLFMAYNELLYQLDKQEQITKNYQKDLESRVEKRTEQLSLARDQALSASRSKSIFLASMSHEIKTPMTAILGYTQLLKQSQLESENAHYVHVIDKSGKHLLSLINEILELSKIESGTYKLHNTDFDLTELIQTLHEMFVISCMNKNINWSTKNFTDAPCYINGDKGKLNQILINLIGNACKFTNEGYISLIVENPNPNLYRFIIEDTGIGMDKKSLDKIFDAFHQESDGANKGGTGLGLNITKRHIELMGSKIHVVSKINKGTKFFFDLHFPKTQHTDTQLKDTSYNQIIRFNLENQITVLVVDDTPENRFLLQNSLTQMNCIVECAENGQQALDKLTTFTPDIIFMDIQMPIMDGMEAIKKIRMNNHFKSLKCIAISASTLEHDQKYYINCGFDYFIAKPFSFNKISEVIIELLNINQESIISKQAIEQEHSNKKIINLALEHDFKKQLLDAAEFGLLTELSTLAGKLNDYGNDGQEAAGILKHLINQADLKQINQYVQQLVEHSIKK